ncbi:hypothetical protein DERP_003141 [Dermatophagoides pteronyssinus]|uniref:Ig-like domain-containing protein n=1 Tax=Dermatophagoides pteronyssinus TaxID=6956 RepID=A0ABQ8JIM5_DERPT|nr:hypothetical protein DERP_003141 [Dermatophagoides pteronyssinus]
MSYVFLIKIECTSSPSNPCSTLTLLTTNNHNGNRIMMTDDDNNNDDGDDQQDVHNINNNNDIHVKTISYQEMFPINYLYNNDYDNEIDTSTSSLLKHRQNDKNHGIFFRTNCRQQQKQQQNEHSNLFQPNHNNRNSTTTTLLALSNKIIYMFQVKADDDQTQLSCIANNPMITNHDKPKFLKISETIELNEWENFQLKILLYSNPSTDSIRMDRIEKMNDNTILDRILISIQPDILLNNLKWENIVDYLKPIPLEWHSKLSSSSLSNNHSSIITLDMINVTRNDYGLYVLRTENSVGYSLMFIRLFIRSISSIDMIRVIVPRKTTVMNQSINNIIKLDNNNTQIEIIELIENNDRNFRIECNVNNGNPSSIIRWTKQFFSKYLQRRQIQIQQQSKLIKNPTNDQHYYYHSNQRLKNMPYLYDYDDYIDDDIDYINFLINSNLQSNDMFIDWSRSNVTQTILSKNSRQQIANSANNNNHHNTNHSHYNKSLSIHSELAINQVNFADSGIYTCHTLNDSRSIAIRIRHRPRIFVSNNLKKIAANIGEISVKFVCSALAYPNVYFNWTRYISTINDDVNVVVDGGGGGGGVDNNNADDDEIQQQQQKQNNNNHQ